MAREKIFRKNLIQSLNRELDKRRKSGVANKREKSELSFCNSEKVKVITEIEL